MSLVIRAPVNALLERLMSPKPFWRSSTPKLLPLAQVATLYEQSECVPLIGNVDAVKLLSGLHAGRRT